MSGKPKTSRDAILKSAAQLLESTGTLTLEQVARAAGVSRQAIYLHFPDRSALIVEVAARARSEAGIVGTRVGGETPRELLTAFVNVIARLHKRSAATQLAVEALCRADSELASRWRKRPASRAVAARELAERLAAGGATDLRPQRAADLIWVLTGPAMFDQLVAQRGWSARAYREQTVALLLASVVRGSATDVPLKTQKGDENGTN